MDYVILGPLRSAQSTFESLSPSETVIQVTQTSVPSTRKLDDLRLERDGALIYHFHRLSTLTREHYVVFDP